jgi:hypothetical protein
LLAVALSAAPAAARNGGASAPERAKPVPPKLITAGVSVGGTLVGGLSVAEARAFIERRFARRLEIVVSPSRRVHLTPAQLGARAKIEKALRRATRVRTPGSLVPLEVTFRRGRLERVLASIGRETRREPVDARLKMIGLEPHVVAGRPGRRLKELIAAREIRKVLKLHQRAAVRLEFADIRPAVSEDQLGSLIVIRRESRQLYFYTPRGLKRVFRIATGQASYPTPVGRFEIVTKQRNPWWYPPPGSDWARGKEPVPPGPGNPLGTRWMGISAPLVGIHGTPDAASVGYSASHGCVRMLISQAEWLFERVEVGTPVVIVKA